jgi:hypothetical protein
MRLGVVLPPVGQIFCKTLLIAMKTPLTWMKWIFPPPQLDVARLPSPESEWYSVVLVSPLNGTVGCPVKLISVEDVLLSLQMS